MKYTTIFILAFAIIQIAATTPLQAPQNISRDSYLKEPNWPSEECNNDQTSKSLTVKIHHLKNDSDWIQVDCEQFAYQETKVIYIESNNQRKILKFKQFNSESESDLQPYTSPVLTGIITLRPELNVIEVFRKYRGIGDCGQLLTYTVSGVTTKLTKLRVRQCPTTPEKIVPNPKSWPLIRR